MDGKHIVAHNEELRTLGVAQLYQVLVVARSIASEREILPDEGSHHGHPQKSLK